MPVGYQVGRELAHALQLFQRCHGAVILQVGCLKVGLGRQQLLLLDVAFGVTGGDLVARGLGRLAHRLRLQGSLLGQLHLGLGLR